MTSRQSIEHCSSDQEIILKFHKNINEMRPKPKPTPPKEYILMRSKGYKPTLEFWAKPEILNYLDQMSKMEQERKGNLFWVEWCLKGLNHSDPKAADFRVLLNELKAVQYYKYNKHGMGRAVPDDYKSVKPENIDWQN